MHDDIQPVGSDRVQYSMEKLDQPVTSDAANTLTALSKLGRK